MILNRLNRGAFGPSGGGEGESVFFAKHELSTNPGELVFAEFEWERLLQVSEFRQIAVPKRLEKERLFASLGTDREEDWLDLDEGLEVLALDHCLAFNSHR